MDSCPAITFHMSLDIFIYRILSTKKRHDLRGKMNLIECQSVIYLSFDSLLSRRNNSSGILLMMMSNNFSNTMARPIAAPHKLFNNYHQFSNEVFFSGNSITFFMANMGDYRFSMKSNDGQTPNMRFYWHF